MIDPFARFLRRRGPRQGQRVLRQSMPVALEAEYVRALVAITQTMYDETTPGILAEFGGARLDASKDAEKEAQRQRVEARARQHAERIAAKVDRFNKQAVGRQIKAAVGVDLVDRADLPNRDKIIRRFVRENVKLIKSVPDRYFDRVTALVAEAHAKGERADVVAARLRERLGVAKSSATLIARDQVNKLNGALTQERQTAIGITSYVWMTSGDDRVRATHNANQGRRFQWSDPPITTGHPGQDVNCRCRPSPDVLDLL